VGITISTKTTRKNIEVSAAVRKMFDVKKEIIVSIVAPFLSVIAC